MSAGCGVRVAEAIGVGSEEASKARSLACRMTFVVGAYIIASKRNILDSQTARTFVSATMCDTWTSCPSRAFRALDICTKYATRKTPIMNGGIRFSKKNLLV
eukprot:COSAG06_NODE_3816_length_4877_cov_4.725827_5_plen_102_part_00